MSTAVYLQELRTRPLLIQMDDIIRMVNTYISAIEGAINLVSETGKFCHSEALLEHHLSTMSRLESMFHNQLDRVTKNNGKRLDILLLSHCLCITFHEWGRNYWECS